MARTGWILVWLLLLLGATSNAAASTRIAVLPFLPDPNAEPTDSLSFTLAEGAYAAVANTEGAQAVERLHLLDLLQQQAARREHRRRDFELNIGRMAGATHVIQGLYSQAGGVVEVSMRLISVETRERRELGFVHAPVHEALNLRNEVYCTVLKALGESRDAGPCRIETSQLTSSADAQRSYADSLLNIYHRRIQAAIVDLNRALAQDPQFAMARNLRDAIFWLAIPGNQWVYALTVTRPMETAPMTLVRRVEEDNTGSDGVRRIVVAHRIGATVRNEWGECQIDVQDRLAVRNGWVFLEQQDYKYTCPKLGRTHHQSQHFGEGLAQTPLELSAPTSQEHFLRLTATYEGVGRVTVPLRCTTSAQPVSGVKTRFGRHDGIAVQNSCVRDGKRDVDRFNDERSRQYAARHAERLRRIEERNARGAILGNLFEAAKIGATDETLQPEDLRVEDLKLLNIESFTYRRIFIPGLGFVRQDESLRASGFDAGEIAGTMQLQAMQISRMSAASPMLQSERPLIIGDPSHHVSSPFGGRPTALGLGLLLGFARPRYEYIRLSYPGFTIGSHRIFDALGLSISQWLGGVVRISADLGVYSEVYNQGVDSQLQKQMYGNDYKAVDWLRATAELRARISARGGWSIPQLAVGAVVHVMTVGNQPSSSDSAVPPPGAGFGTYNHILDETYLLWRPYAALLTHFSWHDRFILELGYQFSYWSGAFSFDDRSNSISLFTHGPRAMMCVGTRATRGNWGFGVCAHGYAELPLVPSPEGAAQFGVQAAGAMFELVLRRGAFLAEKP